MAKHRSHGRGIQAGNGKSVTVEVPLLGVVLDRRKAFPYGVRRGVPIAESDRGVPPDFASHVGRATFAAAALERCQYRSHRMTLIQPPRTRNR